jgi:ERCC4-related helicase
MPSKLIDNNRLSLGQELIKQLPQFDRISIATGYWDLPGFQLLEQALSTYKSIRLLIGQEPLPPAFAKRADLQNIDETFPENQIRAGLGELEQTQELRDSAKAIKKWIEDGLLEVRVLRGTFLHAKAYIFGDYDSQQAVGVIGSSNFTAAGLTKNLELNYLDDNTHSVIFKPHSENQPHSHLSWFDELWTDPKAQDWNGKFSALIDSSPVGDLAFSHYHMYIKALYEIYGDELVSEVNTNQEIEDVLYDFQLRNSKLLIQKLAKSGVAILADSVGLGKTITAGAVLKTYIEEKDAGRIYVIAPASLTQQWSKELGEAFSLVSGFEIISLQDARKIQQARELDQYAPVDLFILDEAHNLRSGSGSRFDELLEWFSDNPDSHVLLLTATPINNSLKDLKNQIQLGSKGKLHSVKVTYKTDSKTETIDFFDAIERLNKEIKAAITAGKRPDYDKVNKVMRQGLRPYLVRTTRAGITKEFGGIRTKDGTLLKFPESVNKPQGYKFDSETSPELMEVFNKNAEVFEGLDFTQIDLQWLLELTQRTQHPLDSIAGKELQDGKPAETPFEIIFQTLLTLGFAPYKADVYKHKYYGKSVETIAAFSSTSDEERLRVSSQLSIHNMLRVTLLKRLESSQYALKVSIENYGRRLEQFQALLNGGKIGRIKDLDSVLDLFGDDVDFDGDLTGSQFEEFDLQDADSKTYNLEALDKDLDRDRSIVRVLLKMCDVLAENDDKLESFASLLTELQSKVEYGTKVLVFSYYADTIKYLQSQLSKYLSIPDFEVRSAFVTGGSKAQANDLAKRFSPVSKKTSKEVMEQGEIDFLFATDVLSEGQNLQDSGVIVNFDLHWNPVRMIQRNGRINRLGSKFEKVFIFNMHPDQNLNAYLTLVERLNNKIDQIKFSIGTDQSVLGEEANPKEFIDIYSPDADGRVLDSEDDDAELLGEDEFVKDLREFDSEASDSEKELVSNISAGKWGYLPSGFSQHIQAASALALVKIEGKFKHNSESFTSHLFVRKIDQYAPVENFLALSAIRVPKTDTVRRPDTIALERNEIRKKVVQLAKLQATKQPLYFKRTPKVNEAIGTFSKYRVEGIDLDLALDKVQTKQTLKRAKQIVKLINRDQKVSGSLSQEVISTVVAFVQQMRKFENVGIDLSSTSTEGVIYFAS